MNLKKGDLVVLLKPQRDDDSDGLPRFTPAGAQCRVDVVHHPKGGKRQFYIDCHANGMRVIIDDGPEADENLKPITVSDMCPAKEIALRLLVEAIAANLTFWTMPNGSEGAEAPYRQIGGNFPLAAYDFARRVLGLAPQHPKGVK